MARPKRNACSEKILSHGRVFFATTKTSMGRPLLQSERSAGLLIDVLRSLVAARKLELHDFVIMPDHVHLLMTVGAETTIEKIMQLIKGRFSFRLRKEFDYPGEVWQHGYSEVRVDDQVSFSRSQAYIAENPVKAGLVQTPEQFPYCYAFLARAKAAGAKAQSHLATGCGTAKAMP
jgi:putative transposase